MLPPSIFYKRIVRSILANPNGWQNDLIVKANLNFLKEFSSQLNARLRIEPETLFRGLLLKPSYNTGDKVLPIKGRHYTSFTTSIEIAREFANPRNSLSYFLVSQGNTKGFVTNYKPNAQEILFHWKWNNIVRVFDGPYKEFKHQKEVILFGHPEELILSEPA